SQYQGRLRSHDNRIPRPRQHHVLMALGTNPNLSRRRCNRHARAVASLRMLGLISALIIIPLIGALTLYAGPPRNTRSMAFVFNALSAFCALMLWQKFDTGAAAFQFVERHVWIPSI